MGLRTGPYNIETRVATDGTAYIMEVSPRGGGNRLSEFLARASGVNLIAATANAAIGMPVTDVHMPEYDGIWFQEILRSEVSGRFDGLWIDKDFQEQHVKDISVWIESGHQVEAFTAANHAFGSVFLRFDDRSQLDGYLGNRSAKMAVRLK